MISAQPGTTRRGPNFRLDGQVALVTGAGRGIGRALAEGLALSGADVAITELPEQLAAGEAAAREIAEATGRRCRAFALDVRRVDIIDALVGEVGEVFSRIDVLVNNAGVQVLRSALEVSESDWDAVLDVDLKGVFFCARAAGRRMIAQGTPGSIVNVASQMGLVGYFQRAAYCSAKAGVVNLTRVLALEWAPHGIRVNAIAPTFIRTPLGEQTLKDEAFRKDILARIPLGRIGEPEDVVGSVVFLASPASALVTGHTLAVDGGWTSI
jgi:2-dehydro-3-deoxy-D-gluconate 5-dehydrogenase